MELAMHGPQLESMYVHYTVKCLYGPEDKGNPNRFFYCVIV